MMPLLALLAAVPRPGLPSHSRHRPFHQNFDAPAAWSTITGSMGKARAPRMATLLEHTAGTQHVRCAAPCCRCNTRNALVANAHRSETYSSPLYRSPLSAASGRARPSAAPSNSLPLARLHAPSAPDSSHGQPCAGATRRQQHRWTQRKHIDADVASNVPLSILHSTNSSRACSVAKAMCIVHRARRNARP